MSGADPAPATSGVEPVEEWLVQRLDERAAQGHPVAARTSGVLHHLDRLDQAAYSAVARLSTPTLEGP